MNKENKEFLNEVFTLALPTGLQMMIETAVNLIDGIMIGSLGEACISAVSISGAYLWLCNTFVMGFATGGSILGAQYFGSKDLKKIKNILSFLFVLALGISLIFFICTALFPATILRIYSNVESIVDPGVAYLSCIKWSIPLLSLSSVITIMLRSVRSVKLGLWNSLLSCFTNVFFNWVFIFGNLGAPRLGIVGAALGTLMARLIQAIVSVVYLLYIDQNLKFRIPEFDPYISKDLFKTFMKISIPVLIMDILANLVSTVQTMITGRISENYVSANSITHMAWQLPNVFCWGVGNAAGIMIGNSLGDGNFEKAKADSRRFFWASFGFGLFSAGMVQVILPILLTFYNITEATKTLATQMGYMASIAVFFIAFNSIICNGVVKSGGHTKKLLKVDLIGSWCIAIPCGFIAAFVLKWPAFLLYIILRAGNIIKSCWGVYYMFHGNWMQKLTK